MTYLRDVWTSLKEIRADCRAWPEPEQGATVAEHLAFLRAKLLADMLTWRFSALFVAVVLMACAVDGSASAAQ